MRQEIFQDIYDIMTHPFKKCQIKLLGDSITAGVGSERYGETSVRIPGTTYHEPTTKCYSYANLLRSYMEESFDREMWVSMNDPFIHWDGFVQMEQDENTMLHFYSVMGEEHNVQRAIFSFYGEQFTVAYSLIPNGGTLRIFVDGVLLDEVETSCDEVVRQIRKTIQLSEEGNHTVRLESDEEVHLEGILIKKSVSVTNYGMSGINSAELHDALHRGVLHEEDDLVFLQIGTNDRHEFISPAVTKNYVLDMIKLIEGSGKYLVLMCANPASEENERWSIRNYTMQDVHRVLSELAVEREVPFISHYEAFSQQDLPLAMLLADGLHPNNKGYELIVKTILRRIGLPATQRIKNPVCYE